MTKSEKNHAQIFVIVNFILFVSVQIYTMILDFSAGLQTYSEITLILCWVVLSFMIWKMVDRYDRKRIRDINLSFLFLNILCIVGSCVPKDFCYYTQLMVLMAAFIIGISIVLYKKYASKSVNHKRNQLK